MFEQDYVHSSVGRKIDFTYDGELKATMKTSINKYPTLLYPNNRPISSFDNKCINND